ELVGKLVVAFDRRSVRPKAGHGRLDARFCDVLADSKSVPIVIAGPATLLFQTRSDQGRDLVVADANGPAGSTVQSVQSEDSVCGSPRASEKIEDRRVQIRSHCHA